MSMRADVTKLLISMEMHLLGEQCAVERRLYEIMRDIETVAQLRREQKRIEQAKVDPYLNVHGSSLDTTMSAAAKPAAAPETSASRAKLGRPVVVWGRPLFDAS